MMLHIISESLTFPNPYTDLKLGSPVLQGWKEKKAKEKISEN